MSNPTRKSYGFETTWGSLNYNFFFFDLCYPIVKWEQNLGHHYHETPKLVLVTICPVVCISHHSSHTLLIDLALMSKICVYLQFWQSLICRYQALPCSSVSYILVWVLISCGLLFVRFQLVNAGIRYMMYWWGLLSQCAWCTAPWPLWRIRL